VLLAYFITVIGIGLYKGRGDKTMEGFAVGNRSIPWWAKGKSTSGSNREAESTDAPERGGLRRSGSSPLRSGQPATGGTRYSMEGGSLRAVARAG
jgi:hypothetical protein